MILARAAEASFHQTENIFNIGTPLSIEVWQRSLKSATQIDSLGMFYAYILANKLIRSCGLKKGKEE